MYGMSHVDHNFPNHGRDSILTELE